MDLDSQVSHRRSRFGPFPYALRFAWQKRHRGLGQSQVLSVPSCPHDSGSRVRVLAEKQVAQLVRDDAPQNHLGFAPTRQFPDAVRVNIGHYAESVIRGLERRPEDVRAGSLSFRHGVGEKPERQSWECVGQCAGSVPDSLLRSTRTNQPGDCEADPFKNTRGLLLGSSQDLCRNCRIVINVDFNLQSILGRLCTQSNHPHGFSLLRREQ